MKVQVRGPIAGNGDGAFDCLAAEWQQHCTTARDTAHLLMSSDRVRPALISYERGGDKPFLGAMSISLSLPPHGCAGTAEVGAEVVPHPGGTGPPSPSRPRRRPPDKAPPAIWNGRSGDNLSPRPFRAFAQRTGAQGGRRRQRVHFLRRQIARHVGTRDTFDAADTVSVRRAARALWRPRHCRCDPLADQRNADARRDGRSSWPQSWTAQANW